MTNGDSFAHLIWILLVLVMVLSSLTARRIPLVRLVTWSAGWAALFLGVYLLFTMLEPHITAWQQDRRAGTVTSVAASPSAISEPQAKAAGAALTIPMGADGHYWVDASVSGRSVRFLIDSGASITGVSTGTAQALGLPPDPMGGKVELTTANGTVTAERSVIAAMNVGSIQAADLPVVIAPAFGEVNVLGMNFLNKLKGWRVEDGSMILEPR